MSSKLAPVIMADKIAKAAQLKAEGNALFSSGDFDGAHGKYSLALALDENNLSSVLFSNRAMCLLHLKRRVTIPI